MAAAREPALRRAAGPPGPVAPPTAVQGAPAAELLSAASVRRLAAADVLAAWERTSGLHPIDAALEVLALAIPAAPRDALARLPIGDRDRLLLRARGETLGDAIEARGTCPSCGTEVELTLSCSALVRDLAPAASDPGGDAGSWTLAVGELGIRLRPLDSIDAAAAARLDDPGTARRLLLRRAVVEIRRGGVAVGVAALPEDVERRISDELAAHDPAAEILLAFTCPQCGTTWSDALETAAFVVAEIADRGRRVLADVDLLARAYGWSEGAILALEDRRRATYAALVDG